MCCLKIPRCTNYSLTTLCNVKIEDSFYLRIQFSHFPHNLLQFIIPGLFTSLYFIFPVSGQPVYCTAICSRHSTNNIDQTDIIQSPHSYTELLPLQLEYFELSQPNSNILCTTHRTNNLTCSSKHKFLQLECCRPGDLILGKTHRQTPASCNIDTC